MNRAERLSQDVKKNLSLLERSSTRLAETEAETKTSYRNPELDFSAFAVSQSELAIKNLEITHSIAREIITGYAFTSCEDKT